MENEVPGASNDEALIDSESTVVKTSGVKICMVNCYVNLIGTWIYVSCILARIRDTFDANLFSMFYQ